MKEEINKFVKMVEKYCIAMTNNQQSLNGAQDPILDPSLRARRQEKMKEINDYIALVDKYKVLTAEQQCTIMLEDANPEYPNTAYNIVSVSLPKLNFTKNRKLTADDEIWTIMPYKDFTPEQKYKKYRKLVLKLRKKRKVKDLKSEILRRNVERAKHIKNEKAQQTQRNTKENKKEVKIAKKSQAKQCKGFSVFLCVILKAKQVQDESEIIYCVCKSIYHGELMTGYFYL